MGTPFLRCFFFFPAGKRSTTVKIAAKAGANVFVAGSYVFGAKDVDEAVASLFKGAERD